MKGKVTATKKFDDQLTNPATEVALPLESVSNISDVISHGIAPLRIDL